MGDHPRLEWPDVPSGVGMQSLMAILEHMKDIENVDHKCAADDAETVLLAVRSKIYPGLPDTNGGGPIVIGSAEDVEVGITNAFGDATAAREVMEDIIRTSDPAKFTAEPLASLSWVALLLKFLPVIIELLKKWLEGKE